MGHPSSGSSRADEILLQKEEIRNQIRNNLAEMTRLMEQLNLVKGRNQALVEANFHGQTSLGYNTYMLSWNGHMTQLQQDQVNAQNYLNQHIDTAEQHDSSGGSAFNARRA